MPAGLPGSTLVQNQANPSVGQFVIMDPLSGPKGSPFDAKTITGWANFLPTKVADPSNISTGGLSTGIGFGANHVINQAAVGGVFPPGSFTDDYIPGESLPSAALISNTSTLVYIGGGRSDATGAPTPYDESMVGLCGAGNGGSRDGGAGPAFTGFPAKSVTATGSTANGVAVETGWVNRSGVTLAAGESTFGSGATPNAAVT